MDVKTKVSLGTLLMILPLLPSIGIWYVMQYRIDQIEQVAKAHQSKADDRDLKLNAVILAASKLEVRLDSVDQQLAAMWRRTSN